MRGLPQLPLAVQLGVFLWSEGGNDVGSFLWKEEAAGWVIKIRIAALPIRMTWRTATWGTIGLRRRLSARSQLCRLQSVLGRCWMVPICRDANSRAPT